MTDISLLKVSLTKHNAHKIARLLKEFTPDKVLNHLEEVHAERAQALKNLSASKDGSVPEVWKKAKNLGDNAIDALVLVGIIFSHHKLISAMCNASSRSGFSGRIERGEQLDKKEYTNFSRILDQLGFASKIDFPGTTFNLKRMFEVPGLGPLAGELLGHKLKSAKWDSTGSIANEAIAHNFHQVFGISDNEFKKWLANDIQPSDVGIALLLKDEEFFQESSEEPSHNDFIFKPGHVERAVEKITRSTPARIMVNQRHNDIQNRLYKYLSNKFGAKFVGTELDTGSGTSIDVVVKNEEETLFYEIKTSPSVRTSIRQAIPQLLEYAYWPDGKRADKLIIVSHLPITKTAKKYIEFLRKEFNLPLYYHQFSLTEEKLI